MWNENVLQLKLKIRKWNSMGSWTTFSKLNTERKIYYEILFEWYECYDDKWCDTNDIFLMIWNTNLTWINVM